MKPLNCNHWFDPHIRKVIDLWSHPVWFISKKEEQCHCLNDVSKQPNPDCPTCLGLGNKLRFTREYAANLNLAASIRATGIGIAEKNIMNVYYTKNNKDIDIDIKPGDIVYWKYPEGHVGIYIGNNRVIHAPQQGDHVKISTIWTSPNPPASYRNYLND